MRYIFFLILLVAGSAEVNYRLAIDAVQQTDLTDEDITNTMQAYGFEIDDPFQELTYIDKIKAIF